MTGTKCIDITDPSRKESLGHQGECRRIAVRFYYPGADDPNGRPCDLLTEKKRKACGKKADFSLYNQRIQVCDGL